MIEFTICDGFDESQPKEYKRWTPEVRKEWEYLHRVRIVLTGYHTTSQLRANLERLGFTGPVMVQRNKAPKDDSRQGRLPLDIDEPGHNWSPSLPNTTRVTITIPRTWSHIRRSQKNEGN